MLKCLIVIGLVALTVAAPTGRVVNGTDANIEDYPFMVSITGERFCGGSILNEYWILTAAHCSGSKIKVGIDNLTEIGESYDIILWIRHEKYNSWTLENDIAVVRLAEPIVFSNKSEPVELPEPMYEVAGSWEVKANLTGFGYNKVY